FRHGRACESALHDEQFAGAEREFQSAVRLSLMLHPAYYGLGQVYMMMKRYPLAVIAYRNARDAFHAAAAEAALDETEYERHVDAQIRALDDAKRSIEAGESERRIDP